MHPWRERVWTSSLVRRSTVKRRLSHLYRAVLPGLCLPLANYLVSFFTPDLPYNPPQHICIALFQEGFQPRGLRGPLHYLLWDGAPPFLTPEEPSCTLVPGGVGSGLPDLKSDRCAHPLSYFCRAQLLPLTLSLEYQGRHSSSLTHLTNSSCSAQGPICPLLSADPPEKQEPWGSEL